MKDLKESNFVGVAEFAKARNIDDEPAFLWWVPYTLKKWDIIISKVTTRTKKTKHNYDIVIPTSIAHAQELDRTMGKRYWMGALDKVIFNAGVAFQILENDKSIPPGWTPASDHIVWDIKMDFTRKARWVLDGYKSPNLIGSRYDGKVFRESVRIALTYAALNDLDVCAGDIQNVYLQAPPSQKDWIICGPEFGLKNANKRALIKRSLYGDKATGRDFRNHLRDCMRHLNFESCLADPNIWMRPAKKADNSEYYEFVLLYVDNALCISENVEGVLRNEIGKYFKLKEKSIGPPKLYLVGHMRLVGLKNGSTAWAFISFQYVRSAADVVAVYLEKIGWKMPRGKTPISTTYRPELDISPELDSTNTAYYQSLIGILT